MSYCLSYHYFFYKQKEKEIFYYISHYIYSQILINEYIRTFFIFFQMQVHRTNFTYIYNYFSDQYMCLIHCIQIENYIIINYDWKTIAIGVPTKLRTRTNNTFVAISVHRDISQGVPSLKKCAPYIKFAY